MSRLSVDDWVRGRPDLQRELSLLRENLASERQAKIERGEMLVKAEADLATLRHDLSVAQNWVEHYSKHADDLIAVNAALRAALDPERIIAAIALPGGHYCDPQAVADAIRVYCRAAQESFDAAWARSVESGIAARQTDDPTRASLENINDEPRGENQLT